MRPLPASPFDACDQASATVTAQSLVRYKTNDYSVPVAYGHRQVWVRGYVDDVVIGCGGEIIARHPRSWELGFIGLRADPPPRRTFQNLDPARVASCRDVQMGAYFAVCSHWTLRLSRSEGFLAHSPHAPH